MKRLLIGVLAGGLACYVLAYASGAEARQNVSPDRSTRPPFIERFLASTGSGPHELSCVPHTRSRDAGRADAGSTYGVDLARSRSGL